jgi:hypothetical protein
MYRTLVMTVTGEPAHVAILFCIHTHLASSSRADIF